MNQLGKWPSKRCHVRLWWLLAWEMSGRRLLMLTSMLWCWVRQTNRQQADVCILVYSVLMDLLHVVHTSGVSLCSIVVIDCCVFVENPSGRHWRCGSHWHWHRISDNTVWWPWTTARWCCKFLGKMIISFYFKNISLCVSHCIIHFGVFYIHPYFLCNKHINQ